MSIAVARQEDTKVARTRYTVLPLSKIKMDGTTQPRDEIRRDTIIEFAEAMKDGVEFPPVIVFYDGLTYWLADGFHRATAAKRVGQATIQCDVRMGGQREAVLFGCGANAEHGLRRTNEDKKRSVMRMLNDDEWGTWTDHRIAEYCKVSSGMVSAHRIYATNPLAMSRIRLNSRERLVDTSAIGRNRPKATPVVETVSPIRVSEPIQRTAVNPIQEFARKLKAADIPFKENVKTDFGLVMFETEDAIYQVVPMLTTSAFMAAFTTILYQRKQHAPAKKAVIVGRIMDDARPWVALARHWKVDVKNA